MKTVDIIIPAYNEEHRIGPTLRAYLEFFDDSVRFIPVLNGCRDNTRQVVDAIAAEQSERVHVLEITEAVGKGAAIIYGWKRSSAEVVGFVDADGATPPQEFAKLLDALPGHEGVIASRFIGGSIIHSRVSWLRTVVSHSSILLVRLLFWMPFRDTQCGAKVFTGQAMRRILDNLQETGMMFDVELLWRMQRLGARVMELPTEWTDQPGSAALGEKQQFLREALRSLRALLRLRLRLTKP